MSELPEKPKSPDDGGGISCQQARRQIERMIEECDLKEVERTLLLSHVRSCPQCKAELENYRRLEIRLKETFAPLDTAANFNERLMAALPQPGSSDSPAWARVRTASGAPAHTYESGGVLITKPRSVWRRYWTFWAVSALVAIGLIGAYLQHGFGRGGEADSEAIIADVSGNALHLRADGRETTLQKYEVLRNKDTIIAKDTPVNIALNSGPSRIGHVVLAPNSKMTATNRHSFQLVSGTAYFQVMKDRPKLPNEVFEVDAGGHATVRVTGTAFCVDLNAVKSSALVVVEEGRVEVVRGGNVRIVEAGQEIDAMAGTLAKSSNVKSRLTWMHPAETTTAAIQKNNPQESTPVEPAKTPKVRIPLDWGRPVSAKLIDCSLAEGVELIAETLGNPPELNDLLEQARGPAISTDRKLSFSVVQMPLSSALAWMARDVGGLSFECSPNGTAHFRLASNQSAFSAPVNGAIPDEIRKLLDVEMDDPLADAPDLPKAVDRLSARSGVEMIVDRSQWEKFAAVRNTDLRITGRLNQKFDTLLTTLHLSCAWYDNAIYISSPSRIEALTTIERSAGISPSLVGQPVQQLWLSDLRELFMRQTYPPEYRAVPALTPLSRMFSDNALSGKTAFANLVIDTARAEVPVVKYNSGVLGQALMASVLGTLQSDFQPAQSLSNLLSQPAVPGIVPDIDTLVEQARKHLPAVENLVKVTPFTGKAFVNKTLTLGESLEWAAWLSGCGLRQENNSLIIDKAALCYGPQEMQVLTLSSLSERRPAQSAEFPRAIARLLPELYPTFFANTEIRCIGGRIVFTGDTRQVQVAQRVRTALERALDTSGGALNLQSWRPATRVNIERNLSESFKADGVTFSGSFAGLLRQSALSYQLHCTVLVDPQTMKQHAATPVSLDVKNMSLGQVLDALAAKIGAKAVIEGDVIWVRP